MSGRRRSTWIRALGWGVALGLVFLTVGDRGAAAPPNGLGIDPFEVLDLQVKNNVLIVLDTSGSMKWPTDVNAYSVGGDDPTSRLFQAKAAIRQVVNANQTRINFGLATYNLLSSDKTLNRNQDFDDDRRDGPFVYVSADAGAQNFYIEHSSQGDGVSGDCDTVDGFFCQINPTFANYDDVTSAEVWRSFSNRGAFDDPYPVGCTVGSGQLSPVDLTTPSAMQCRYYLQSRLLRNNVRFTWNRGTGDLASRLTGTTTPIPGGCPAPPAGLLGYTATPPICFQLQEGTAVSTFYYTSALFQFSGDACGGGALINSVSPCAGNNAPGIGLQMDPELPVSATGTIPGLGAGTVDAADGFMNGDQPTFAGLRADQGTPLGGTLNFIRTAPITPDPPGAAFPVRDDVRQRNYVILLTDGDDTCSPNVNPSTNAGLDENAVAAAVSAEALFDQGAFNPDPSNFNAGTDPRHRAETFVVAFAGGVNLARSNVIAQGGSGANITAGAPIATAVGSCKPGATCRNAFSAQTTQQLIDVLNQALSQTTSGGEFSTTASVFDSVPEYADTVPVPAPSPPQPAPSPANPLDPTTRYRARAFRNFVTTFVMPNFEGHLKSGGGIAPPWDAGAKLMERLENDLAPAPDPTGVDHTFAELHGGLNTVKPSSNAHIDRRIFTTARNGVNPGIVMLWPPSSAVAPADYTTAGTLDNVLGIGPGSSPVLTAAQLQAAPLRACAGSNRPPGCTSGTASVQRAAAVREAREMILAFTAGAAPRLDGTGSPVRNATTFEIAYRRRPWLLAETTLGTPAVVVPPFEKATDAHAPEYVLYRDGPRIVSGPNSGQNPITCSGVPCTDLGFGLKNPDRDGRENPPNASTGSTRLNLKPVMSVVYVPANDMLHAFRAGPCPPSATALCPPAPNGNALGPVETGGEELYGFVPYDLLPNLRRKLFPQNRDDHTFMLANSVRFGEIFVPGNLTVEGVNYTGRWRRILVVGRGFGSLTAVDATKPALGGAFGHYYTALDITAPGPFTEASLDTQLPSVLWSRGNPDRQTAGGARNGSPQDETAYAFMGQTWSPPAISRVNGSPEYVVYVGSGYPEAPAEGTGIYTLNAISGQVVDRAEVNDSTAPPPSAAYENAIVAGPVVYTPELFTDNFDRPNPAGVLTRGVYVGDIHGRMWKIDPDDPANPILFQDFTRSQPVGVAAAMFNLGTPAIPGLAGVFVTTGNEARVPVPASQFQMWGLQGPGSGAGAGTPLPQFPRPFLDRFRGTLQPRTTIDPAFGEAVFFVGTRFNLPTTQCVSSFDTVLFALNVRTGGAAYDIDGSGGMSLTFTGVKAVGMPSIPRVPGEELQALDQGVPGAGLPPASSQIPADSIPPGAPRVTVRALSQNSPVCR